MEFTVSYVNITTLKKGEYMTKVRSEYFNQEFDVTTYEREEEGRVICIINHDALEDIILNQISPDTELMYDYEMLIADPKHPAVKCIICDKDGRRVQAIGEASPDSLETKIARTYPVLMASQRAFDRAAIRFLALPGKVFSNLEVGEADNMSQPVSDFNNMQQIPSQDTAPIDEFARIDVSIENEAPIHFAEAPINSPDTTTVVANDGNANEDVDYGSILVDIGSYKNNPKTVAEVVSTNMRWAEFMTSSRYVPKTDDQKKQINALKKYLAQHLGDSSNQ